MRFQVLSALALVAAATAQEIRMGAYCENGGAHTCDPETPSSIMVCQNHAWVYAVSCKEGAVCSWPQEFDTPHCL
ncbi:hypothetical protein PHISP_00117 [Aspergillus sp. HF37]|nr:hypothetical protein PHISP_00117 [Aspergillus sp. HF37]